MTATYLALQPSGQLLVRPRPANWRESVDAQAFAPPPAQRQKAAAVSVVHASHDSNPLLPQKHIKRKHDIAFHDPNRDLLPCQFGMCVRTWGLRFRSACASCGKSHTSFVITWFQTRVLAMPPRALVAKSSWCVRISVKRGLLSATSVWRQNRWRAWHWRANQDKVFDFFEISLCNHMVERCHRVCVAFLFACLVHFQNREKKTESCRSATLMVVQCMRGI